MRRRTWWLAAVSAAVAVVVGGGAAFAANAHSGSTRGVRGTVLSAVTGYLGLSGQQLGVDLRGGETLAQIAAGQGKSLSGLEQAIEAAVQGRLNQAVTAGKLTSEREQLILSRLPARLDTLLNRTHPGALVRLAILRRGVIRVPAAYLGLPAQTLRAQLQAGKTLAQIATDQSKTATGLEQAIEAAAKTRLDQAVASGRITSAREQLILSRLPARLDTLLNHTFTHP
jgi:hypothetical protein